MARKGAGTQPIRESVPGLLREAMAAQDQRLPGHPQGVRGHELADGSRFRVQAHAGTTFFQGSDDSGGSDHRCGCALQRRPRPKSIRL